MALLLGRSLLLLVWFCLGSLLTPECNCTRIIIRRREHRDRSCSSERRCRGRNNGCRCPICIAIIAIPRPEYCPRPRPPMPICRPLPLPCPPLPCPKKYKPKNHCKCSRSCSSSWSRHSCSRSSIFNDEHYKGMARFNCNWNRCYGSCGYDPKKIGDYVVGISRKFMHGAKGHKLCGPKYCIKVWHCDRWVIAKITDTAGEGNDIVLSEPAFARLSRPGCGVIPVKWKFVRCKKPYF